MSTDYTYVDGNLTHMERGYTQLHFYYDSMGAYALNYNGEYYYYLKNAQGDITGIVDTNGDLVVTYVYNAWGELMSMTGSMADDLGYQNPLRYRGYVYDTETNLYYLQSRYYDPQMCRFINADNTLGQIANTQGTNMFEYAFNNPVMHYDPSGHWPKLSMIFTAIVVTSVLIAAVAITVATCGATAPAMAIAGGIIGGISATATSVATGAMIVASVSTVAAITSAVGEKSYETKMQQNNTVYRLVDINGQTQYVGRTTDVVARQKAHEKNPDRKDLTMYIIKDNLNYYDARGLEQISMLYYHTINTSNRMNNQINGISPLNKRLGVYMEAGRGVARYVNNQISNEILYWTGN